MTMAWSNLVVWIATLVAAAFAQEQINESIFKNSLAQERRIQKASELNAPPHQKDGRRQLQNLFPDGVGINRGVVSLPVAWQSGPLPASTYPSRIFFNSADGTVVVTGSTYSTTLDTSATTPQALTEAGCFIWQAALSTNTTSWTSSMSILQSKVYYTQGVRQACADVTVVNTEQWLVAGHALDGGLLQNLASHGQIDSTIENGMLLHFVPVNDGTSGGNSATAQHDLVGGRLMQKNAAVYPVRVTAPAGIHAFVYVASIESPTATNNANTFDWARRMLSSGATWDPNLAYTTGSSYLMVLSRYAVNTSVSIDPTVTNRTLLPSVSQNNINGDYRREFSSTNRDPVYVTGYVALSENVLVVAGSTMGQGEPFGSGGAGQTAPIAPNSMDGFVTAIHAQTGELLSSSSASSLSKVETSSLRLQSLDGQHDVILGMCSSKASNDTVYVVGGTKGHLQSAVATGAAIWRAYAAKVQISTMEVMWTRTLTTAIRAADIWASDCAVTHDGETVWMVGTVGPDAVVTNAEDPVIRGNSSNANVRSYGATDAFVAQLFAKDGAVEKLQQIGSPANDTATSVTVDSAGNAILVGHTAGPMYRSDFDNSGTSLSDMFVASVSLLNGQVTVPVSHTNYQNPDPFSTPAPSPAINSVPVVPPTVIQQPPPGPTPVPVVPSTPNTPTTPVSIPVNPNPSSSSSDEKSGGGGGGWIGMLFLLLFLVVVVVGGAAYAHHHYVSHHEVVTDRRHVLAYLNEFNVDDIDLKHSATGGWHCSYANSLAQGKNLKTNRMASAVGSIQHPPPPLGDHSRSGFLVGLPFPRSSASYNQDSDALMASSNYDPLTTPLTSSPSVSSGSIEGSSSRGRRQSYQERQILEQSLFMDEDDDADAVNGIRDEYGDDGDENEPATIFGRNQHNRGGVGGGYDGLVDAYNETWDPNRNQRQGSHSSQLRSSGDEWGKDIV